MLIYFNASECDELFIAIGTLKRAIGDPDFYNPTIKPEDVDAAKARLKRLDALQDRVWNPTYEAN